MILEKRKDLGTTSSSKRYVLKENDEGPHYSNFFNIREWWYYNVLFNNPESELRNWSAVIAISALTEYDSLKLILHDNADKSYGGIYLGSLGTTKVDGPGVNVKFYNSFIRGVYPNWHVFAENITMDENELTVDLDFTSTSFPMWIFMNTGRNLSKSPFGYYLIINCDVKGKVKLNDTVYKVSGLGYYDHTWSPGFYRRSIRKKKAFVGIGVWDWLCIHFDNGWDMFVGKIYSPNSSFFSKLIPGSLCLTPDGKQLIECFFFELDYKKYRKTTISSIKTPSKINIKARKAITRKTFPLKGPLNFNIYYEADNIKECICGTPPNWGQWESTGKVYGEVRGSEKNIKLNGWGIMEISRKI
ncbi:MAG: hypothetical protein JSW60_08130 [Thermoplasmatales archaeon]|nr:MAG: hypothetical protein JSW60_08130 [Thermoplasmatales archaeon]